MRSSRAGTAFLLLLAAGVTLYALARLVLRSDSASRIRRGVEWAAIIAIAAALVLAILAGPFNE